MALVLLIVKMIMVNSDQGEERTSLFFFLSSFKGGELQPHCKRTDSSISSYAYQNQLTGYLYSHSCPHPQMSACKSQHRVTRRPYNILPVKQCLVVAEMTLHEQFP
jgi:hypothetical protein